MSSPLLAWQDRDYRLADREMNAHENLYVLNLSLLATHQVDAAYWHEWDVFGVPGGLPFFLVFNLAAVAFLAVGVAVRVDWRFDRAPSRVVSGGGSRSLLGATFDRALHRDRRNLRGAGAGRAPHAPRMTAN